MLPVAERLDAQGLRDPVAFAISQLDDAARAETVRGQWVVEPAFKPSAAERKFVTPFLIVHVERQGCAYCSPEDLAELRTTDIVGLPISACIEMKPYVRVAVTDAAFATQAGAPAEVITLDGTVTAKARGRAAAVTREVDRLLAGRTRRRVALVGYSGEIAAQLSAAGHYVEAYDLDSALLSQPAGSPEPPIHHGSTLFDTHGYDVVVATGMTLVTQTFDAISRYCANTGTQLLMYCQTGANLGWPLIANGAAAVVAEPLPFYNWEGVSYVRIYRP